jgi:putative ATP-dependent endonuclease of OLD family
MRKRSSDGTTLSEKGPSNAEATGAASSEAATPIIYQLTIERFRGIKSLKWNPGRGLNMILDAIALLLSPTNQTVVSDTDYYGRDVAPGFSIDAIIGLPPDSAIYKQSRPTWPWAWNGKEALVPQEEPGAEPAALPVFRLRVRGTEELELLYEIVEPNNVTDALTQTMRGSIGIVRLGGDSRNDRDLRLVQGSALDRLLSDKTLRSRLTNAFAKSEVVRGKLSEEAQGKLTTLDETFRRRSLPSGLDLELTGSQGTAITALIGLTALRENVQLPLAAWGSGTRRLAALAIAEEKQGEAPITLVDEVERGLEPYRQRDLVAKLLASRSQGFVTTHSPPAIAAAAEASLWYADHLGAIGQLDAKKTKTFRERDPEMFLARLSVVAEGVTEVGFVQVLLERALPSSLEQHGIRLSDGGGHESTLGLLEALAAGGLAFGGFADEEGGKHPDAWKKLKEKLSTLLFRWREGCIEENVFAAVADDRLEKLLLDPLEEKTGLRLRTLADRLDSKEKEFPTLQTTAGARLKTVMLEAALGKAAANKQGHERKELKAHAQAWFKTVAGGRELGEKLFSLGLWPNFKPQLLPFCNAIRRAVGESELPDLPQ